MHKNTISEVTTVQYDECRKCTNHIFIFLLRRNLLKLIFSVLHFMPLFDENGMLKYTNYISWRENFHSHYYPSYKHQLPSPTSLTSSNNIWRPLNFHLAAYLLLYSRMALCKSSTHSIFLERDLQIIDHRGITVSLPFSQKKMKCICLVNCV